MKLKLLAGAALAGLCVGTVAYADPADSGWYGAIDLGVQKAQPVDTKSQFGELGGGPADLRFFSSDGDFAGFARIGYKITPHVRVELEAGYRTSDMGRVVDDSTSHHPLDATGICGNKFPSGGCTNPPGELHAWTGMANVLVDILPRAMFDPFIGGGGGSG
jgi:OmpA-OmpF porin, OOP family